MGHRVRDLRPLVVAGPTATGKSALALALADALGGELVCADSRQVYAGFGVAAAGPEPEELGRAPHHLYGAVDPTTTVTAGAWARAADACVMDVMSRGLVPILVGGTGLYLRAWRVGLEEPSDAGVRAQLEAEADAVGVDVLHARLATLDAEAALAIAPTDRLRVVRALEIVTLKGGARGAVDLSTLPPRVEARWLLLDAPLDVLEPRIRARAARMFAPRQPGAAPPIVDEAVALAARLGAGHRLLQTLGTAEALALHAGALTLDDAVGRTVLRTRQYARRQRTWFKKEPWWTRIDAPPALTPRAVDALVSRLESG